MRTTAAFPLVRSLGAFWPVSPSPVAPGGPRARPARRGRLGAGALALVAALSLGACAGGDPAERREGPQRPFRSAFAAATSDYRHDTDALKENARAALTAGRGADGLMAVYESMLEVVEGAHDAFDALRPPPDLADDLDRLVTNLDRQERTLRAVIDETDTGRADSVGSELERLATQLADFARLHQRIERQLA